MKIDEIKDHLEEVRGVCADYARDMDHLDKENIWHGYAESMDEAMDILERYKRIQEIVNNADNIIVGIYSVTIIEGYRDIYDMIKEECADGSEKES